MTEPSGEIALDWEIGLPPSTRASPSVPNQPVQAAMTWSWASLVSGMLPPWNVSRKFAMVHDLVCGWRRSSLAQRDDERCAPELTGLPAISRGWVSRPRCPPPSRPRRTGPSPRRRSPIVLTRPMTRLTPSSRNPASRSTRCWPSVLMWSHHMWTEISSDAGSRPISSHRARTVGRAAATSDGSMPSRFSSSACLAARRHVTLGPLPPTMIGTRGRWTGLGTLRASVTLSSGRRTSRAGARRRPSSALTTSRSSASRASRSRVSGKP